jgi:hypothetical protein
MDVLPQDDDDEPAAEEKDLSEMPPDLRAQVEAQFGIKASDSSGDGSGGGADGGGAASLDTPEELGKVISPPPLPLPTSLRQSCLAWCVFTCKRDTIRLAIVQRTPPHDAFCRRTKRILP